MSAFLLDSGTLDCGLLKNSFFKLYETHIVIKIKKEIKIFHIDEISNVRFSKKRNYALNVFLLFIILGIYSVSADYLHKDVLYSILLVVIAIVSSIISLSVKYYNYILLINISRFGFRELKISKKESHYAEYFVSIFKTKYSNKKNQNNLDFVNFRHSS